MPHPPSLNDTRDAHEQPAAASVGLPTVNLEERPSDSDRQVALAKALDEALQGVGFCYVSGTGVPRESVAEIFMASKAFHRLPRDAKDALAINEFHRGYIAPASSVIRSSSVAKVSRPNLSDSFMWMHEVAKNDPDYGRPLNGPNQWPPVEGFRTSVERFTAEMDGLARYLVQLIAIALGVSPGVLASYFERPTVWLRLLHYPPLPGDADAMQWSAAPHTDYGFITLLAQDVLPGLEVRDAAGQWRPAPPQPDTFVLNVADMLERMSDGRWPSSAHRVRNTGDSARFSIPYFFDPHIDCRIERLPGVAARTGRQAVIFGDYVLERLNRNYAYRQSDL